MSVTDDELQQKRQRNAEAHAYLQELTVDRTRREQEILNDTKAKRLDAEYEQIQAAIRQAEALNEQAEKQADLITGTAVVEAEPVKEAPGTSEAAPAARTRDVSPPKPDNSAQASGATAEGK